MSEPTPSPCINVCRMDAASGWCDGCLRTLEEIAAWSSLTDEARRQIWLQIDERQRLLSAAVPGQARGLSARLRDNRRPVR